MNIKRLSALVGPTAFNHAAYPVCQNQIENAVRLFEALGWQVERRVDTAEFRLAFLTEGTATILLTDETGNMTRPGEVNGNHIAISVKDAPRAAQHIYSWLAETGLQEGAQIEQWDKQGLKWGVTIPVLGFSLELITAPATFNWRAAARNDGIDVALE